MIPFFAQTPPATLTSWLEVFFYIVGGVTSVVILVKQLLGKPDRTEIAEPIDVRAVHELVTKTEHEKHVTEIREELKRHAQRRAEIYDQQRLMTAEVREIKATNQVQSEMLRELRADAKTTASKVDVMMGEQKSVAQQLHQISIALQKKP